MQTNQYTGQNPDDLLYQTLTYQANMPLVLNHPRARYLTTRAHPYIPKTAENIQISQA